MPKALPLLFIGNPALYQISEPIAQGEIASYRDTVDSMVHTLESLGERIGLAAPQVGIFKRLVIFKIPQRPHGRYKTQSQESVPLTVMINPTLTALSPEQEEGWEACISVPHMMGKVSRYTHIRYSFYDLEGAFHEREAVGFHARVVQHECDHLDGILYTMRIKDMTTLGLETEITAHHRVGTIA